MGESSVRDEPAARARPKTLARAAGSSLPRLLQDLGDDAGADGAAALADGEAQALVHGDRHLVEQGDADLDVVAGHAHLDALRQRHRAGHVRGAEVELRLVTAEE